MSETSMPKAENEKFCADCGEKINIKAEICPKCGVRQMIAPNSFAYVAPNGKSKIAAALLAFFLGGFGIHHFYLGNVGLGILYLLFCWTFVPAFISLIESVLLLVMTDERFNEKYGQLE